MFIALFKRISRCHATAQVVPRFLVRVQLVFSAAQFALPHTSRRVDRKHRATRARVSENVVRLASPAAISDAHSLPKSAQSADRPAPLAMERFSPHARDRYLPPQNPGVAPDARAKTSLRFSRRARPPRPDLRDECVVLHANHGAFLPDTSPFFSNHRVATKPVALNHATLPPA